jgi:hypothetical protein
MAIFCVQFHPRVRLRVGEVLPFGKQSLTNVSSSLGQCVIGIVNKFDQFLGSEAEGGFDSSLNQTQFLEILCFLVKRRKCFLSRRFQTLLSRDVHPVIKKSVVLYGIHSDADGRAAAA